MGLDASVFCDCFEKGRLLKPPDPRWELRVDALGFRTPGVGGLSLDDERAFDRWDWTEACEHEMGRLVHHYMGNIWCVAVLRGELSRRAERFPILLGKVIYSGSHCGDWLDVESVKTLRDGEMVALATLHGERPGDEALLRVFESQMRELIEASLCVGKPIVF